MWFRWRRDHDLDGDLAVTDGGYDLVPMGGRTSQVNLFTNTLINFRIELYMYSLIGRFGCVDVHVPRASPFLREGRRPPEVLGFFTA